MNLKKFFSFFLIFLISSLFLTSCEGKGKLVVKEPPNADVFINGKHVGKTPLEIELKEGKYEIVVATTPWDLEKKKDVQIYFDKTTILSFKPTPKGELAIDSKPQGAIVMEGRNYIGTTPFKEKLDVGKHLIVIKYGAVGTSRKINIEYQKTTNIFVNLEKAVLHFNTDPQDAKIYIDGKAIASNTVEIDEGIHEITVEKDVYKDTFKIKVKKGDEFNISYKLEDVQLPPVQAYAPVLITKDYKYFVTLAKGGVYFWDIKDIKPHISLYDPEDIRNFDRFSDISISEDGNFVAGIKPIKALAYKYKDMKNPVKVVVWDMKTTAVIQNKVLDYNIGFVEILKDKLALATKDGNIYFMDIKSGQIIKNIPVSDKITAFNYLNGKLIAGTGSGKLIVLNENGIENSYNIHSASINDIQISKDKKYIITASADKTAKLLISADFSVVKTISTPSAVFAVNISPSNTEIAISNGKIVNVYSFDGKLEYSIKDLQTDAYSIAFVSDDILVIAGSRDNTSITLWQNGHLLRKWVQTIE